MQIQGINGKNTTFGTKVYASGEALNAINKAPKNAKSKIFKHIKDLKNNGVDDVLLLRHEKSAAGNDALIADIYGAGSNKNEYLLTIDWSAQNYIVDPFTYGDRKSYISIKGLYNSLIEEIACSNVKMDKSLCDPYIKQHIEL